jgi:hypothetical protein
MADEKPTNGVYQRGQAETSTNTATGTTRPTALPPLPEKEKPAPPPKATREGVSAAFNQFGQLMQASRGPFATQHGGSTFGGRNKKGKFSKDLKYIGLKGKSSQVFFS